VFNDRLWDVLTSEDKAPIAVVIIGLDSMVKKNLHGFVKIVHNLLSLTEGVGLQSGEANRQVAYFFVGSWG
jgi:hypothetical protein